MACITVLPPQRSALRSCVGMAAHLRAARTQLLPHPQRLPLAVHIGAIEDSATMSHLPNLVGQSLWFLLL